jgi:glycosyltransferase involved in cell wall biosynthesis
VAQTADDPPLVSVVIPTHNRSARLRRNLDALASQTLPAELLEVVVVADGCTDDTVAMLHALRPPFRLRTIAQPQPRGPAASRNAGAAAARGRLLVFLDDDIEPAPSLVEAHLQAHAGPEMAVIGYAPPMLTEQSGFFRIALRRWWESMFAVMRDPGHRFHAFDLLSGNMSLPACLFRRVGGFDPAFTCHEDYELGVRLMEAGVLFAFAHNAVGHHHEQTDLRRALRRKFDEGCADVDLGRRHPEIRDELPLAHVSRMRSRRARAVLRLAFLSAAHAGLITTVGLSMLGVMERARARTQWRRVLDDLLLYWYWRGVADRLGSVDAALRYANEPRVGSVPPVEIDVDLSRGIAAAQQLLEATRPAGARIRFGTHAVGRIVPRPGAEPLCARHLPPALERHLAVSLLDAMAQDGAIPPLFDPARLRRLCAAQPRYQVRGIEPA